MALPICFLIFNTIRLNEKAKFRENFNNASIERIAAISDAIDGAVNSLKGLEAFYNASDDVSLREFDVFSSSLIARNPALQALEWIPLVPQEEKSAYEKKAQRYHPNFEIFEFDEKKVRLPVKPRPEYFPVFYVIPYIGNEQALGFDLASNTVRKESLDYARTTGNLTATARVKLVQEKMGSYSVLMLIPVYKHSKPISTEEERSTNLKGFVLGVFRIADIVSRSLSNMTALNIGVILKDLSASEDEQFLYYYSPLGLKEEPDSYPLSYSKTIKVDGRVWSILCISEPDYSIEGEQWIAWSILLNSLLIVFLISGYLISLVARNEKIKLIVDERTKQLRTESERVNLLNEQLSKKALAFRKFVPEQFLNMLHSKGEELIAVGEGIMTKLTICFIDMRSFTTIAETLEPEETLRVVNHFFARIIPNISEGKGFIDKFTGDGMLVIFSQPDQALTASIKIIHDVSREPFLISNENNKQLSIHVGIAIHSGNVLAGTVGTENRMQTTVIGDTVNTCSRIEQLNKVYGTQILLTEEVFDLLMNKEDFIFRSLGPVEIRGKKESKRLFEVLDVLPADERVRVCTILNEYNKALHHYEKGEFEEALKLFKWCHSQYPEDKLTNYFLNLLT